MKIKNILSDDIFDAQEIYQLSDLKGSYNSIILKNKNLLTKNGYTLTQTITKNEIEFDIFSKNENDTIILANDIVVQKNNTEDYINWRINTQDISSFIKTPGPVEISYTFSFPLGKYNDHFIKEWAEKNKVPTRLFLNLSSAKENQKINNMFFSNKSNHIAEIVAIPFRTDITIENLETIGYVLSDNKTTYFVNDNNKFLIEYNIPKEIHVKNNNLINKIYIREVNDYIVKTNVDLNENKISHSNFTLLSLKEGSVVLEFEPDKFELHPYRVFYSFNTTRSNKMEIIPYMARPNAFIIKKDGTKEPQWLLGKHINDYKNITEESLAFLKGKNYETLDKFKQLYYNYKFKIGDNSSFEETLHMIEDPENITPEEAFLLDFNLGGDFVNKNIFNKFISIVDYVSENSLRNIIGHKF